MYLNDPREVNSDEILTEIYALWFDTRNLILKQELKHSKVRSISS
ncbi:hypothetical protein [Methanosarcina sp.]